MRVVRASVPDKEIEIAREGLSYLFEGCNDLTIYKSAKSEKAKSEFKISWESDRALRLVLILLDPEEPADVRVEAAICAEGLFSTERVILAVANQLYSRPLPVYADLEVATQGTDWPKLKKLIVEIFERQSLISIQRATWDSLSNKLFEDDDRIYFEEAAIRFGAFRILSMVDPQSDKRNFAIMECHKILASLPNARTIVTEWTKNLRKPGTKLLVAPEEPIDIKVKPIKIHDEYEHSRHQRKAISDLLRRGNILTARRFTDQLIDVQLRSGSDLYAAKSLCDLAQAAKSVGLSSLQLEWAQRATNISPLDAWAHGQAADALSGFYRFDEALEEYALCEKLGDAHFAAMGRARILRLQGRLDDALKAFREAQSNFQGHEHEWFSWAGSAETLRDMWKFKDSLAEYDRAVEKFPDISVLLCGRASVLTDLGQLDEALSVYKRITAKQDDLVALNGIAAVLKQKRRTERCIRGGVGSHCKISDGSVNSMQSSRYIEVVGRSKNGATSLCTHQV